MVQAERENSIIVDRAAAAEMPAKDTTREWARDKRIFISSVMSELPRERSAVAEAICDFGALPIMFEKFGGRDANPENAYLGEVETSEVYIGIVGRTYGRPLPSRYSATHAEFRQAEQHGLRLALWALRSNDREGHAQSFLDELRVFYVVPNFDTPEDLKSQVQERLRAMAAEDLTPWCKLGNIIFRATEVSDVGDELLVIARVRSGEVIHALEALRPGKWNSAEAARFTWAGRSRHVRVKEVHSTTTAARSTILKLRLEIVDSPQDHTFNMSINSHSPAELLEIALRTALFGERNPLKEQHFGFMVEIADPFGALRSNPVPEEILRPLAELLLVDELVGSGRVERVTQLKLGVRVGDKRPLTLSFLPTRRYKGDPAQSLTIDGTVHL
jgi:hypothetical protein